MGTVASDELRASLLGLIVLATAGFVVGTTIERNSGESHHESAATLKAEGKTSESDHANGETSTTETTTSEKRHSDGAPSASQPESTATHEAESSTAETRAETGNERSAAPRESATASKAQTTRGGARSSARGSVTGARTRATVRTADSTTHSELKPLGINVEAVPFIVLAAFCSLALALAVWWRPRTVLVLLGVAATMLVFALLDIREVSHQSDEARTGLAVLAGVIATLHLAGALVASVMARNARSTPRFSAG